MQENCWWGGEGDGHHLQEFAFWRVIKKKESQDAINTGYLLFFNSCRKLQSIDISWCWEVTDVGLEHVVHNCTQMIDMNICGAKDLHGKPLKEIPQCMPRLRRLDATQCNLVPDELLDELVSVMPQMTAINYYGEEVFRPKYIDGAPIVTQGGWCK